MRSLSGGFHKQAPMLTSRMQSSPDILQSVAEVPNKPTSEKNEDAKPDVRNLITKKTAFENNIVEKTDTVTERSELKKEDVQEIHEVERNEKEANKTKTAEVVKLVNSAESENIDKEKTDEMTEKEIRKQIRRAEKEKTRLEKKARKELKRRLKAEQKAKEEGYELNDVNQPGASMDARQHEMKSGHVNITTVDDSRDMVAESGTFNSYGGDSGLRERPHAEGDRGHRPKTAPVRRAPEVMTIDSDSEGEPKPAW